jgi:fructosamine-3-kinase
MGMPTNYSEIKVRTHVVGVERLEAHRWRVSVDGRRLFTFCSEARARNAGRLEARRLDFVAEDRGVRMPAVR